MPDMMQSGQMPTQPAAPMQGMPHNEAAEGAEGPNTITINMTPGAITINSAAGTKQCESIGECLQTLLEMYEGAAGDDGEGAMMSGYADQPEQEARPVRGGAVK